MMLVRYNSLEERFMSFIKLFDDTWSGLIAVIETFASVNKSVQFVDVAYGLVDKAHDDDDDMEQKPDQAGLAYTNLARTVERKTSLMQSSLMPFARRRRNPYIVLAQESRRALTCSFI